MTRYNDKVLRQPIGIAGPPPTPRAQQQNPNRPPQGYTRAQSREDLQQARSRLQGGNLSPQQQASLYQRMDEARMNMGKQARYGNRYGQPMAGQPPMNPSMPSPTEGGQAIGDILGGGAGRFSPNGDNISQWTGGTPNFNEGGWGPMGPGSMGGVAPFPPGPPIEGMPWNKPYGNGMPPNNGGVIGPNTPGGPGYQHQPYTAPFNNGGFIPPWMRGQGGQ